VLVGEAQREVELARLGEEVLEAVGERDVVVDLVDVHRAVASGLLGHTAASEYLLPNARNEQGTEEPAGLFAERALGQAGEEQSAVVENAAEREGGLLLTDDRAHRLAQQERAQLVEQRADRLDLRGLGLRVVPSPEAGEHRVIAAQPCGQRRAPGRVGQAGRDLGKGEARVTCEGEDAGAQEFAAVDSFTKYVFERGTGPDPQIALAEGRLDELLNYAEANADGELARRESCANAARKAVERFCRELAVRDEIELKKRMSVEDMVERLHQRKAIDDLEVGTLHRLRKFGNRGSHEDEMVNPATSAILTSVNALRGLRDKHLASGKPALRVLPGGATTPAAS
jgi:hypothetical protein